MTGGAEGESEGKSEGKSESEGESERERERDEEGAVRCPTFAICWWLENQTRNSEPGTENPQRRARSALGLAACRTSSSRLLNKTASPFWPDQPVLVFSRIFRPPLIKFFVLVDRTLLLSSDTAAVGGFRSF